MKKNLKVKFLSLFLCIITLCSALTACSAKNDDKTKNSSKKVEQPKKDEKVKIKEKDNKIFVSLKDAFKSIGANYEFKDKSAEIKNNNEVIKIKEGSKEAEIDSSKIKMEDEIKLIDKELYASLDSLKKIIDGKVIYDENKKSIDIKSEMKVEYSKGFSIKYLKDGMKQVVDGDNRTLLLVPEEVKVPEKYKDIKGSKKKIIIKTPIKNVFTGSSTQTCFLRPLNEISSLKAVTLDAKKWTVEEVKKGIEDKRIAFVGRGKNPNYEKIKTINPDITFTYSGPFGQVDLMKKLDELKLPYAVDNEYMEEDPLGRMEWIKFVGAFYNKEDEAEKKFNDVVAKVNKIKQEASKGNKPKVVWGSISKGDVYVPKANSYAAKMIELAGGEYVFNDNGKGSSKISLEDFYSKGKEADIFICAMTKDREPSIESIVKKAPTVGKMKPVIDKKVWCFARDYYQSIDKTDEIIEDLYFIIHPEKNKNAKTRHFQKYDK